MAWPPTPSAPVAKFISTLTTIQWGTDGLLNSWIVESMRARDVNEVIYIENGTGIRSIRIQLFQGREWDITVIADNTFRHPGPGTDVTVSDPLGGQSGAALVFTGVTIANEYDAQRKREGRRVISVVFDTNIEGHGNVPALGTPNGDPGGQAGPNIIIP